MLGSHLSVSQQMDLSQVLPSQNVAVMWIETSKAPDTFTQSRESVRARSQAWVDLDQDLEWFPQSPSLS